jgi:hypothetical protein
VSDQAGPLLAWLEGEGKRRRRKLRLPPGVWDFAVRGWVQVGVTFVAVALAAGLLVCWLATARGIAGRHGDMATIAGRALGPGLRINLEDVRVEAITRDAEEGVAPLILIVKHRDFLIGCAFPAGVVPPEVQVGDRVSIRGTVPVREEKPSVLTDCELVVRTPLPGE